ncbi:ArfGap-domain-containing protein [Calocera viscosa TUFC12733]|uniref:ArfGap-domain-containing protein n=1 Tax=Calocera viscosa (strain TUFC12733) TaxID=1330018 RepID=A0A167GY59_CALVF|nr:ArfGap-domain-containing protein [Calocera viscosa TUFC12733]
MSGISKVTAERHQRILLELAQQPGNDICADCKARYPRWASWNLGIFLCVQCASVHRKIGTHVTKVKSLTLDSWTREQVDSIKNMGNIKSNAYFNPDERRNPPPTNMEDTERDSELEKYIRSKYEYKKFVAPPGSAAAVEAKKLNGLLPPPPPKEPKERGERVPRSRTAPLPAILASKPSPPPVPANESPARMPAFSPQQPPFSPSRPGFQPSPSPRAQVPQFPQQQQLPPQFRQQQIQLPPRMPQQRPMQPPTPSALPPTSPLYGEMMALQTGSPLPTPMGQSMSMPPGPGNPFNAMQSGTLQYPSAFNGMPRSPSRSVSLPVTTPGALGTPTISMQPTGMNPFFAQQQQQAQQNAFLQATSPTGYPSPFQANAASVAPISIPLQSQATGYFNPSPQSASYLSPSPSNNFLQQPSPTGFPPGTSPFSAAYGAGSSTSPFQQGQFQQPSTSPFSQQSSSPFQQMQQPAYAGTPTYAPPSPFSQMSASPFGQPQAQAQEGQGNLGAFASGMMPRQSTNPFQR